MSKITVHSLLPKFLEFDLVFGNVFELNLTVDIIPGLLIDMHYSQAKWLPRLKSSHPLIS